MYLRLYGLLTVLACCVGCSETPSRRYSATESRTDLSADSLPDLMDTAPTFLDGGSIDPPGVPGDTARGDAGALLPETGNVDLGSVPQDSGSVDRGSSPPDRGRDGSTAEETFESRCQAEGVVACYALNSVAEIERHRNYYDDAPRIVHDPSMQGARFTIPPLSPANTSGNLTVDFSAMQQLYFAFDVYYPRAFLNHRFSGGKGWKTVVLGHGSAGCAPNEVVFTNSWHRSFPQAYYMCGAFNGVRTENPFGDNIYEFDLQPGGDTQCLYSGDLRDKPCQDYIADRWVTYQLHVDARSGRLEAWQTVAGATTKLLDYAMSELPTDASYTWLMLTPYHTGKDSAEDHATFEIWYRRVIISRSPIPNPTN